MMKKILSLFFAVSIISSTLFSGVAAAAQPNQLTVSPAFIEVQLSDSNKEQKTQIAISNTYASNIDLTAELKGIDEIAGKLLPVGNVDPIVDDAIKLSNTELTATAKETTILEVSVLNSPSLPTGGHYATLVLSQRPKPGQLSGYTSQISISIFIVKLGGERQSVETKILNIDKNLFVLPHNVKLAFKNTGNMHVTPRASAIVTTSSGQIVAKGVANTGSQPILPGKSFESTINSKQTRFLWFPQKLKLTVNTRMDGSETVKQYQNVFWYVPPIFIIGVMVILAALTFSIWSMLVWLKKRRITKRLAKKSAVSSKPTKTVDRPKPAKKQAQLTVSKVSLSVSDKANKHIVKPVIKKAEILPVSASAPVKDLTKKALLKEPSKVKKSVSSIIVKKAVKPIIVQKTPKVTKTVTKSQAKASKKVAKKPKVSKLVKNTKESKVTKTKAKQITPAKKTSMAKSKPLKTVKKLSKAE